MAEIVNTHETTSSSRVATVLEKHWPILAAYLATHLMCVKLPISLRICSAERNGRGEKHHADWSLSWDVENARSWKVRPPTVMPSFNSFLILNCSDVSVYQPSEPGRLRWPITKFKIKVQQGDVILLSRCSAFCDRL